MTSVWFVTPAFQRYELTSVCLRQRQAVIASLASHGIEGRCVVVADDENLDIARGLGFDTVERDNEWLGRRFNDGMEYAGLHGADYIVPIGSDSWIDPAYFWPLPAVRTTRTSERYCVVEPERLGTLRVTDGKGAGPYMFPRHLLERRAFRPAKDEISRGVDGSTIKGLVGFPRWQHRNLHPYAYVGFRQPPMLSSYETLMKRWGHTEHPDPWRLLGLWYPADLVAAARQALGQRVEVAA